MIARSAKSFFSFASALLALQSSAVVVHVAAESSAGGGGGGIPSPPPTTTAAFTLPLPFLTARTSPANPALTEYADAQDTSQINLRLDIGRVNEPSRLPIDNLLLELTSSSQGGSSSRQTSNEKDGTPTGGGRTLLPGADGPNPGLSSGRQTLAVVEPGRYITLAGSQTVPLTAPAWEIVWRYGSPAGSVVFGFQVPDEIKRNDAKLPSGRMYVSFPVWTKDGMDEARDQMTEIKNLATKAEGERDDAIESAKATQNPLMKALHYREAFAAQERYDFSGIRGLGVVPSDDDVVSIGGELLLVRRGLVWTKGGTFLRGDHSLLGHATVAGVKLGAIEGGRSGELRP